MYSCAHKRQVKTSSSRKLACQTAEQSCTEFNTKRLSKVVAATEPTHALGGSAKLDSVPAVFADSGLKYGVKKIRDCRCAVLHNERCTCAQVKDAPSGQALKLRPELADKQLQQLQRSDKESVDLYGMLPLSEGMPVAFNDHVDRHPEKHLL